MEKLFERISSYNLLNNLLPGAMFCYLIKFFVGVNVIQNNIIDNLFLYYFIGMIISRTGSLIIEPICKKTKFLSYSDYNAYILASEKDEKIDILLEVNNIYRTFLSACIFTFVIKIYYYIGQKIQILLDILPIVVILFLITLFALSYRKQTKYIKARVGKQMDKHN